MHMYTLHACMHACRHAYMQTHIHACMHADTHTHTPMHACMHACADAPVDAHVLQASRATSRTSARCTGTAGQQLRPISALRLSTNDRSGQSFLGLPLHLAMPPLMSETSRQIPQSPGSWCRKRPHGQCAD